MIEVLDIANKTLNGLIGIVAIGAVLSSCTSTKLPDNSGSSSHNSLTSPRQTANANQLPPLQAAPKKNALPGINTPAPVISQADSFSATSSATTTATSQNPVITSNNLSSNSDARSSGVIYQNQNADRSLGTQPTPLNQTQTASLGNPGLLTNAENDNMNVVDPNSTEILAEQRVEKLYGSMTHATCNDGWATPPDKLDAKRVQLGHPYYMEMRLRHTPLLPVGHTYIAYGRMSEDGTLLSEHVVMLSPVGGYGGAAVAAALPMPGILKPVADDCRIKPHAAYRVSLTAVQYEQLLLRIKKAQKKIPAYALFAYNCNHFASDIAGAVGILPPKNIYLPAVQYIYGVIEANEGYNPKKVRRG